MNPKTENLIFNILLPIAVGGLSGLLTMGGMKAFSSLNQPPLSPPGWLFPVVWTVLYALMGFATYLVWNSEHRMTASFMTRESALQIYGAQLIVNFFWSVIFFGFKMYLFAFFWLVLLWALIVINIIFYEKIRPLAGWLLVPYLFWVTFAGYLNFGVFLLNP